MTYLHHFSTCWYFSASCRNDVWQIFFICVFVSTAKCICEFLVDIYQCLLDSSMIFKAYNLRCCVCTYLILDLFLIKSSFGKLNVFLKNTFIECTEYEFTSDGNFILFCDFYNFLMCFLLYVNAISYCAPRISVLLNLYSCRIQIYCGYVKNGTPQ